MIIQLKNNMKLLKSEKLSLTKECEALINRNSEYHLSGDCTIPLQDSSEIGRIDKPILVCFGLIITRTIVLTIRDCISGRNMIKIFILLKLLL